ncbi:hypothetical protein GIB67_010493 [Kingdonia uniflora]|uniref:Peptidase C14 caspase domain-containing protein n=1 Tax=Kingdonia uniflora TaxID=39325 RepID=A0A7J7MAL7_9MAGN|nr:hypothetical protein GIB67_010493 [Kingdonia uniflora]
MNTCIKISTMEKGGKKMAVLVGCNYVNTKNELHGCINDVHTMHHALVKRFGFKPHNIKLITDAHGSKVLPTGANIMKTLSKMVDQAEPGDVLFLHYSGHGTQIPTNHGRRHEEAIVPCDFNLITDLDFRKIVNRLPEGVSFTIISDSCHSGGLIDNEKEQIGPSTVKTRAMTTTGRPKMIPIDSVLSHLTSLSGIESSNIGTHLSQVFGNEASVKYRSLNSTDLLRPTQPDSGILLSGCQANETSADMNPSVEGGKSYGAFSNAVHTVLKKRKGSISNKELIVLTREILRAQRLDQHPCLYCSDENVDAPFLGGF